MGTDFLVFPLERRKANDHTSFYQSLIHIAKLLHILLPSPFFQNKLAQICSFFFSKLYFLLLPVPFMPSVARVVQPGLTVTSRAESPCVLLKNNTVQTYNNGWIICIHVEEEKGKLLEVFRRQQCGFEQMSSICLHLKLANWEPSKRHSPPWKNLLDQIRGLCPILVSPAQDRYWHTRARSLQSHQRRQTVWMWLTQSAVFSHKKTSLLVSFANTIVLSIFVIPKPSPQPLFWKAIERSATHWFNAMGSAGLMRCLGTVNAGLRALKDTHRALGDEVKKTGFILKIILDFLDYLLCQRKSQ